MKPIIATYYLKNQDGLIVSKIEATDIARCLMGNCYSASSWSKTNGSDYYTIAWEFVAEVYCKFDGCTHWYFFGEGYDPESRTNDDDIDAYYHLCGPETFIEHIRNMCFIWKVAEMALIESYDSYDGYNDHVISDAMYSEMIQENYEVNGFTGEIVNKMLEGFTITKE